METNPRIKAEKTSPRKLQPGRYRSLPLRRLRTGVYQPRSKVDSATDEFRQLKASIRAQGILNPLLVSRGENTGSYDVIGGERRLKVAEELGLDEVPVRDLSGLAEVDKKEAALMDNLAREGMNALDVAVRIREVMDLNGFTLDAQACRMGTTKARLSRQLAILKAPDWLQAFVRSHGVGYSVSEVFVRLLKRLDEKKVKQLASRYQKHEIGKRDLERFYKQASGSRRSTTGNKTRPAQRISELVIVDGKRKLARIRARTIRLDQAIDRETGLELIEQLGRICTVVKSLIRDQGEPA